MSTRVNSDQINTEKHKLNKLSKKIYKEKET